MARHDGGPSRALLITADATLRDNLLRILADPAGRTETVAVAAVAEAIAALAAGTWDVVLLDMLAAGSQGLAALAALREGAPDCALLAITAEPHEFFLIQDLLRAGAQDCLVRQCLLTRCRPSEAAARTALWCAVQRRRAERRLDFLAHHDPLTGLPNRTLVFELLRRALAASRRSRSSVAVLALDLDGFKAINDRLGHEAGDRVLQETALRIRACLREADLVGRLGGDEFVVVLDGSSSMASAAIVQQKIERALAAPIALATAAVTAGVSTGIALSSPDDTIDALLARADAAMYRSKRRHHEAAAGDDAAPTG